MDRRLVLQPVPGIVGKQGFYKGWLISIENDSVGGRINHAKSIFIGNHCWIGEGAKILKGVRLEGDIIVSSGAIVTKSFSNYLLIGGVPGKVLKTNVTWDKKRL